jgi:large subunit GTPase 1
LLIFDSERRNVHVVAVTPNASHHTQLLSAEEEAQTLRKFAENKQRLRVPRRAPWNKSMTKQALDRQEKDAFIEWRRGLAEYVMFVGEAFRHLIMEQPAR